MRAKYCTGFSPSVGYGWASVRLGIPETGHLGPRLTPCLVISELKRHGSSAKTATNDRRRNARLFVDATLDTNAPYLLLLCKTTPDEASQTSGSRGNYVVGIIVYIVGKLVGGAEELHCQRLL